MKKVSEEMIQTYKIALASERPGSEPTSTRASPSKRILPFFAFVVGREVTRHTIVGFVTLVHSLARVSIMWLRIFGSLLMKGLRNSKNKGGRQIHSIPGKNKKIRQEEGEMKRFRVRSGPGKNRIRRVRQAGRRDKVLLIRRFRSSDKTTII